MAVSLSSARSTARAACAALLVGATLPTVPATPSAASVATPWAASVATAAGAGPAPQHTRGTTVGVVSTADGFSLYSRAPGGDVVRASHAGGTLSGPVSLGGVVAGGVAAARRSAGDDVVAVRAVNDATYVKQGSAAWTGLGGVATSRPAVVEESPGRLRVFVRGGNGALYTNASSAGAWSGWLNLGGVLADGSGPAAAVPGASGVDVFVQGSNRHLYTRSLRDGVWSDWLSLGGVLQGDVAAASPAPGRVLAFVRAANNALYTRGRTGEVWDGWRNLGGQLTSAPGAAAEPSSGRVDVVVEGVSALYRLSLQAGEWTGFQRVGSPFPPPPFTGSISPVTTAQLPYSYRAGCPVPVSSLRLLTVTHHGFDGGVHSGQLVVNADVASAVLRIFSRLYSARFPIQRIQLVDAYGGSDDASMAANNTSAFNCRKVTGGTSWSQHSYGRAVDVNPVQNPYVSGTTVLPTAGAPYVTRSPYRTGVVLDGSAALQAFTAEGWKWGGHYTSFKDWQHFSSTGL